MISFENPTEDLEQPANTSNQPSFINVDSQGLESPLDLLGSQDPLDDQAVPPLVWFGDESDQETSFDSTEQQVFRRLVQTRRCLQQRQHIAHSVLVAVGLRLLRNRIRVSGAPSQRRDSFQVPLKVLQHMDEFMADQHAADHGAHRPLLDRDGTQPAWFGPVSGVFAR